MKQHLHTLFTHALAQLQLEGTIHLERTREIPYGDFACNAALVLAKKARMRPRDLASQIIAHLPKDDPFIAKVELAGPGFINIFLKPQAYHTVIDDILTAKAHYGESHIGAGKKVIIEFVSANPTGPLHVGHGRGAAYGAVLANLLAITGFTVHKEYYINDAGRQMDILATSVWLRYLDLCGETVVFPSNAYQGDYVWDIAADLHRAQGDALRHDFSAFDGNQIDDKELLIDALIKYCQDLLGKDKYQLVFQKGLSIIIKDIRHDLHQFGVDYDEWFSEATLAAQQVIEQLKSTGHTYEQEGALWFRSTDFGDEKDRVLVRKNGHFTYFATDIAYHQNKISRGFDQLINIWGADHHGYVSRVKAAMTALGIDAKRLTILLVQFATLYRGKERLQMSTRSGEFVTLRELREEVGCDAARYFYIQRKSEQHLNFDLALAKLSKKVNPVYYIQYAHTRIASVFRSLGESSLVWCHKTAHLKRLESQYEHNLLVILSHYPEVIEMAAQAYEPHQLTYYLHHVAEAFHAFYDAPKHKVLIEDDTLRNARLSLISATQQVLRNGLTLIGVEAKEVM